MVETGQKKLFQPAFGCAQYLKTGGNTQQGAIPTSQNDNNHRIYFSLTKNCRYNCLLLFT